MRLFARTCAFVAALSFSGCGDAPVSGGAPGSPVSSSAPASTDAIAVDEALSACSARWASIEAAPALAGSKTLDADRLAFIGRARGAMTLFVRDPEMSSLDAAAQAEVARFSKEAPGLRVARLVGRHKRDKALLRAIFLREGYVLADRPEDAYELEAHLKLTDLFDEPKLVLERGEVTFELELETGREPRYVIASGPDAGETAVVMFGDRVRAATEPALVPLHRDVVALSQRDGLDRLEIVRRTDSALLVRARYGSNWVREVLSSRGAALSVECIDEPASARAAVSAFRADTEWRRRAHAAMRDAISGLVDDALPFDRPRSETGPDKDGSLRPYWSSAYLSGRTAFEVDGEMYPVYRADGRAWPPSVCVDFVLDCYERASGSWYAPLGKHPGRSKGRLDLSSFGIENRRGVIGFFQFAESRPDLFTVRKLAGKERIPFADRSAFFAYLRDHGDEIEPGDLLAIQGLKRDDRVHQHAILVEVVDPLTGLAAGLADHMKHPRRRSWEAIMAEAPKRSLLYHARPLDPIVRPLDPESASTATVAAGRTIIAP